MQLEKLYNKIKKERGEHNKDISFITITKGTTNKIKSILKKKTWLNEHSRKEEGEPESVNLCENNLFHVSIIFKYYFLITFCTLLIACRKILLLMMNIYITLFVALRLSLKFTRFFYWLARKN